MRGKLRRLWRLVTHTWWSAALAAVLVIILLAAGGTAVYAALGVGGSPLNSTATAAINLQKGIVGWWKFDGNLKDSSPYQANGTTTNGGVPSLTTDRENRANSAGNFNGTGYENFSPSPGSQLSFTKNFTLSAWIDPTNYHTTGYFNLKNIFIGRGTATTFNYALQVTDANTISFIKRTGSESLQFYPFTSIPTLTNKWTLVTLIVDGSNHASLYLNGALYGTQTVGTIAPGTNDPFYLGGGYSGYNSEAYYYGNLDDVRIYNRNLSAAEVKALYQEYNPALKIDAGESSLIGWWKLNNSAKDSSPYAANGTGVNVTATTDRKGKANAAYSFNGSNSCVNIPSATRLNATTFSYSAWVYTSAIGANQTIFGSASSGGPQLRISTTGALQLQQEATANVFATGNVINATTWSHVVITYNGTTGAYTAYVNGASVGSGTNAKTFTYSNLVLGCRGTNQEAWNGKMADMRIYSRILSASDVKALYASYNAQLNTEVYSQNIALSQGLVGYWQFNGNTNDATPYQDNATTVTNATLTTDRQGRANSAYAFDGSTSVIRIAGKSQLQPPTGKITLSTWFKVTVVPASGGLAGIVTKDNFDINGNQLVYNNPPYWIGIDSNAHLEGGLDNFVSGTDQTTTFNSSTTITVGTWYLATLTYDGSSLKFYINGSLNLTVSSTLGIYPSTGALNIGRQKSAFGTRFFNGSIDDVRIYNRALSATEVTALYNEYR